MGVEVKAASTVYTQDLKGMRALAEPSARRFLGGMKAAEIPLTGLIPRIFELGCPKIFHRQSPEFIPKRQRLIPCVKYDAGAEAFAELIAESSEPDEVGGG